MCTLQDLDILLSQEREEYIRKQTVYASLELMEREEFEDAKEVERYCKEFASNHQKFLRELELGLGDE